jgi:hypothetical protein
MAVAVALAASRSARILRGAGSSASLAPFRCPLPASGCRAEGLPASRRIGGDRLPDYRRRLDKSLMRGATAGDTALSGFAGQLQRMARISGGDARPHSSS